MMDEDPGKGNTDVENTNLESNKSKVSLLRKGHRFDPFLLNLSANPHKCSPRSPSVHLGYLCRMIAMESCFENRLIKIEMKMADSASYQVVSCGAGFDTTFFRLRNCGFLSRCHYIEIDYPAVIKAKADAILANDILRDVFGSPDLLKVLTDGHGNYSLQARNSAAKLTLISCDLSDTSRLTGLFHRFGVKFTAETFLFSECVLTYVPADKVNLLLRWIAVSFKRYHYTCYEQIRPDDTFGVIMRNHFKSRASPLLNVSAHPDLLDHKRRLTYLAIPNATSRSLAHICEEYYGPSEWRRFNALETAFDEIEEMYLKCSHYSMFEGGTIYKCDEVLDTGRRPLATAQMIPLLSQCHRTCQRFGHKVFRIEGGLFIFGGYSQALGKVSSFQILSPNLKTLTRTGELSDLFPCTQFSGAAQSQCGEIIYVLGGRGSLEETSSQLLTFDFQRNGFSVSDLGSSNIPRRWKHSLSLVDEDQTLVVVGGRDRSQVYKDIQCFSFPMKKWRKKASLPRGLFSHTANVWKNKVIICGGIWSNGEQNSSIFVYDPTSSQMGLKKVTPSGPYIPRSAHTAHVIDSKLYLVGGVSFRSPVDPGLGVVDLITGVSEEFKIHVDPCQNKNPLYNHGSFWDSKSICTVGGGGNAFSFGMHVSKEVFEINIEETR